MRKETLMLQLRAHHYQALHVMKPWWALVRADEVIE